MICFKNNRPAILVGDRLITDYGTGWLADSLLLAAEKAGTDLPFCDDLIASIECYLEESCPLDVLPLDELYRRIKAMLKAVGLQHIAESMPTLPPPFTVSLEEIAQRTPLLLFFREELEKEIDTLHKQGVTSCAFVDRKKCVMALQGHAKWTASSQKMLEELEFLLSRYESALTH